MDKKTFVQLFNCEENNNRNYKIVTDIARGRGINGVDYLKFWGAHRWKESGYNKVCYEYTEVAEFLDSAVRLRVRTNEDSGYNSGVFDYYIPYERIVAVMFTEDCDKYMDEKFPSRLA